MNAPIKGRRRPKRAPASGKEARPELQVGQRLWYRPHAEAARDQEGWVEVTGLGRRWHTLSTGLRINARTLEIDGGTGYSPGRCWLSKEACEAQHLLEDLWSEIRVELWCTHDHPKGMTVERIEEAARLLGIKLRLPKKEDG